MKSLAAFAIGVGEADSRSATLDRVVAQPEAFTVIHRATRRALVLQRFPYGLFYRTYGDAVVVVACMHAKQHPRRWQRRS